MTSPTAGRDAQTTPLTPAPSPLLGRFVWYDLMTPDVETAVAFYSAVVGWTTSRWEMGEGTAYTMWVPASGAPMGGVMPLPADQVAAGVPSHWLPYVGTPDVDATHAEALRLGATSRVAPNDIPTVGRFAVLSDPQGALFAVYTPADAGTVGPEPEVPGMGEMSWHELYAADHESAFAFYAALFGWTAQQSMDMGEAGTYVMYGHGERTYGGMMNRPVAEMPPTWVLYARVPDLDAALAAVTANGGQVANGPMQVPGGDLVAQCVDPRGGIFALHQKVEPAA